MQAITSFREAYDIALPYVVNSMSVKTDVSKKIVNNIFKEQTDPVPKHATSRRWQITPETLSNTLTYIFEKLAHNCYMLCVGKDKVLYKLENLVPSESLNAATQKQVDNLDSNKLITETQRDRIRAVAAKPVRIMQCILKNLKGADTEQMNEYMELLRDLVLPNGVFILNLTDAVILHRDNREPFPFVTGDGPIASKFQHRYHLPIMSLSGQDKYSDIPIPNYDDMFIVTGQKDMHFEDYVVDWDQKTVNKAVFRGGPSGCGYTPETNQRIRLASMNVPSIDAKLTGKGKTIDSNSIKFDPVHGLGMLNTGIKPADRFMTMAEQSKYKYIIHVDGNVNAYRLLTTMMTGSLILRVDSPYVSWVDHLIKPNRDYVLVKPDLSDLEEKIQWCESHPKSAKKIAHNGYEFAKRVLTREYVGKTIEKIFWSLPNMSKFSRIKTRKNINIMKLNKTEKMLLPKWNEPGFIPMSPDDSPPDYPPRSPANSPPKSPANSPPPQKSLANSPPKSPEDLPIPVQKSPPQIEDEIIEFPPNAKKCPIGYLSHTVKGKKMCKRKKNQTQKLGQDMESFI